MIAHFFLVFLFLSLTTTKPNLYQMMNQMLMLNPQFYTFLTRWTGIGILTRCTTYIGESVLSGESLYYVSVTYRYEWRMHTKSSASWFFNEKYWFDVQKYLMAREIKSYLHMYFSPFPFEIDFANDASFWISNKFCDSIFFQHI